MNALELCNQICNSADFKNRVIGMRFPHLIPPKDVYSTFKRFLEEHPDITLSYPSNTLTKLFNDRSKVIKNMVFQTMQKAGFDQLTSSFYASTAKDIARAVTKGKVLTRLAYV